MNRARMGEMLRGALRVFGYQVAFGFFGLMFAPMLMGAATGVRVPIMLLIIAGAGMLMFMDGSYRGEKDCAMSDTLDKLSRSGEYTPSDAEKAKRYARMKGLWVALLGALPTLLLAAYVAATAQPYAYTLQGLPGWINTYLPRAEVGDALAYLSDAAVTASLTDYLRIAVRFMLFPYIGLLGTLGDAGSLLFDRLSPAAVLIMPLVMAIGYQFGPSRRAKSVKAIEKAKNAPRRRLKKKPEQKAPREKKQII